MPSNVLEVRHLVKKYKDFTAVNDISFDVPKGKVIGFLGPNGAGKTTTIQILIGVTKATGGQIKYFNQDYYTHREECLARINFTSAFNTLLGRMSVKENLLVYAQLYNVSNPNKKIDELSDYFQLHELLKEVYWNLSAGQKTRVNLVKSLLNDPELLLMDEPTASLDPDVADKTLTLIEQLRAERQLSILYTSHNMDEITRICDEVIFLDHGNIVAQDTPLNLTKRIQNATLTLTIANNLNHAQTYLSQHALQYKLDTQHQRLHIQTTEQQIAKTIFDIGATGAEITEIDIQKPKLEDVFLEIARKQI